MMSPFNLLTPRCDYYIIQKSSDENTQTNQVEIVTLIHHQTLATNF